MKLFQPKLEPHEFWKWLTENRFQIEQMTASPNELVSELGGKIRSMHKSLAWEFGKLPTGQFHLIITPEGNIDLFPLVRKIGEAKPNTIPWQIDIFRQPDPNCQQINMGGLQLKLEDIKLLPMPRKVGERAGMRVFIRGLTPATRDRLGGLAIILMDKIVGELDFIGFMGHLEVEPLESAPPEAGPVRETLLKAISDLKEEAAGLNM